MTSVAVQERPRPRRVRRPDLLIDTETETVRDRRREALYRVDQLLTQIEDHNMRHGGRSQVPGALWCRYLTVGGSAHVALGGLTGHMLLEACLALQQTLLLTVREIPHQ